MPSGLMQTVIVAIVAPCVVCMAVVIGLLRLKWKMWANKKGGGMEADGGDK
jgi:hypothetical protein